MYDNSEVKCMYTDFEFLYTPICLMYTDFFYSEEREVQTLCTSKSKKF